MSFTYHVSVDACGRRSLARVSTMRPWEREQPSPPPPESPPHTSKGAISSMVVKPSDEEVARDRDEDLDAEGFAPEPFRTRETSPSPPSRPRTGRPPDDSVGFTSQNGVVAFDAAGHELSVRSASPSHHRRMDVRRNDHFFDHPVQLYVHRQVRGGKTDSGPHDHSPAYYRGRGRVNFRDTTPTHARVADEGRFREYATVNSRGRGRGGFRQTQFGHRCGRSFRNNSPPIFEHGKGGQREFSPAYGKGRGRGRIRDISPSYENRSARRYHDLSPVYEPERSGGRVRGISPPYSPQKDSRIFNINFSRPESDALPFRDGATRNNPNIPPRVGDWICRNPLCGNLNFARREYCNNCKKLRYEPGVGGHSSSPHHEYAGIPRTLHPLPVMRPVDRRIEREVDGYKSPPQRWNRDSPRGPIPRHGGRFPGAPVRREIVDDDEEDIEYRGRDKFGRLSPHEWDHPKRGRVELLQERREHAHDDNHWVQKERSRSPVRVHLPKDSHQASVVGRGHSGRLGSARGRGHNLF